LTQGIRTVIDPVKSSAGTACYTATGFGIGNTRRTATWVTPIWLLGRLVVLIHLEYPSVLPATG
jgi:hypothetical protein